MSGHWFFLSYARRDAIGHRYVARLHEQLAHEVGRVAGLQSSVGAGDIGFLDAEGIEPGHQWPDAVARALQSSRVLVCLYSRAFFSSPVCGKEVQVFLSRLAATTRPGDQRPPLIVPVLWARPDSLRTIVPASLADIQHTHAGFGATYAEEGLYQLMSLSKYRDEYRQFVVRLAETIVRSAEAHPLAPLPEWPRLDAVTSAFEARPPGSPLHPMEPRATGPDTARFVFVAARRGELTDLGAPDHAYGPVGGRDWCPYAPTEPVPVGVVSQRVAALENVFYETLPLADRLIDQLREAERTNTIVVIVVDPWSIRSEQYRHHMLQFDEANLVNCGVLIPWHTQYNETEELRRLLEAGVRQTFSRAFVLNASYIRRSIHSVDELQKELIAVISEVRRRMIQRAHVFLPPGYLSEHPLPTITGPGTATV